MSATAEGEAAAPAATAAATTNGVENSQQQQQRKPRGDKAPYNRENETPIEEVYDLTQPIPKVEKPDKDKHEADLAVLNAAMDAVKTERAALQEKIDAAMQLPNEKGGVLDLRSQTNILKSSKQRLIDEKKAMRAQLDTHKAATDKLIKDKKDVRSNLKHNSVAEIDAEIKKLQRQQETTTMSLQLEKKLIKDMDALAASKKLVAVVQAKDVAMDDVQVLRKSLQASIADKDKEIDAVSKELDVIMKTLKDLNEKDTTKRDAKQALFTERDTFKGRVATLISEKEALRTAFRLENDAWYTYQRGLRAQKQMQYVAEKARRDEEYAAKQAAIEAEIAKTIPYEEEQALCDFLAEYLERTYLGKTDNNDKVVLAEVKPEVVIAVKDDPFAGLAAVSNNQEEIFFGKGKQKKKRVRSTKDEKKNGDNEGNTIVPFTLSVDSFEQFGLLQLTPPVSTEQVPASVAALYAKKEWYKQQPRGSVPTAAEMRRQQATASSNKEGAVQPKANKGKTSNKPFVLSSEDFAPLGSTVAAATENGMNWGKTALSSSAADTGEFEEADIAQE